MRFLGENEQGMLRVIVTSFDNKSDAIYSREDIKSKYAPDFQDAGFWKENIKRNRFTSNRKGAVSMLTQPLLFAILST